LSTPYLCRTEASGDQCDDYVEHGAAARSDLEHLWRGVRAHGYRRLGHGCHDFTAGAADRDAHIRRDPALPARLALRVAGDHPRLSADLLSRGRCAEAGALAELRHSAG